MVHGSFTDEPDTPGWTYSSSYGCGSISPASEVTFHDLYDGYGAWSLQTKASIERGCCSTVWTCAQACPWHSTLRVRAQPGVSASSRPSLLSPHHKRQSNSFSPWGLKVTMAVLHLALLRVTMRCFLCSWRTGVGRARLPG